MSARIVTFGDGSFGLLEQPEHARGEPLCVVLLNPGFIDHRGPFRLHVRLARAMAARGFHALRVDAPGIGDHLPRSSEPLLQTSLAALDAIERDSGCRRFVVGGICSAADLGWQMALADPRIVGLLQVDGLLRKGTWHAVGRLLRGLRKSPRDWVEAVAVRWRKRGAAGAAVTVSDDDLRDWPVVGSERGQFESLVARKVEMFHLYTGGASYALNTRQFAATYGPATRADNVAMAFWPECDHTFFVERHRRELVDAVVAWVDRRLGPDATPVTDRR